MERCQKKRKRAATLKDRVIRFLFPGSSRANGIIPWDLLGVNALFEAASILFSILFKNQVKMGKSKMRRKVAENMQKAPKSF